MASATKKRKLSDSDIDDMFAQAQAASELLKALSHEARLLIMCVLVEGEKSVSEIEATIGLPQATVSQHLSRLRLENLIGARRDGRQIYYRIVDTKVATLIGTLHSLYCK